MRLNENEEAFEAQYEIVFDTKGAVKPCGREACIKLIELANACNTHYQYGNVQTGVMEIGNLHHLHDLILGIA